MTYKAPLKDMQFVLSELAGLDQIAALPGYGHADADTVAAILEENAKLCEDVIAPLNRVGDVAPSSWKDGVVTTTAGFKEAFRAYVEGGWQGLQHPEEYGGQNLPKLVHTPCAEMVNSANISFALCPLLTDGAVEALLTAGSDVLKNTYIAKMLDGTWTGSMNLTEPQAGSDLALVRSKAVQQDDGSYRVSGQKIFITYGEHDMAENIVHLVLARTPDAPEGVKGISLFVVPKFLVNADGSVGKRNDVYCASIEHKLGIKASPTAVLLFGDNKGEVGPGAIGYLVGEENRGLEYMFIMMNAARFGVGMQGIAVAERAYQKAVAYARDRVQSRDLAGSAGPVSIIHHPDVKRMLMQMRALIEGARALAYWAAAQVDLAHSSPDAAAAKRAQAIYEFMVPIVKGWSTELSIEVASLGVQVHGGMGFIEETGAAQHYRDARILTIYEGTTAIQANDFIGRKTVRDGGAVAKLLLAQIVQTEEQLAQVPGPAFAAMRTQLAAARSAMAEVVDYMVANLKTDIKGVFAGSVPYLKLAGMLMCGWQMARAMLVAQAKQSAGDNDAFWRTKIATAHYYADHILSQVPALRGAIVNGGASVNALAESEF